ncbi:MAG: Gfo/Idh/MocA family oxidoreductase, partial [Clostridia bacterium]|nr:Gfo/Idh/MocA family oxidoreductase [Clostridia bacterium]
MGVVRWFSITAKTRPVSFPAATAFRASETRMSSGFSDSTWSPARRASSAVIAVPHPLHSRIADEALRAGLHVLSEKPLDLRVSDARKAVAAGKETGRV